MCKSKLQLAQIVEQMRKVMGFLCLVSCWGGATCPTTVIREQLSDLVLLVGTTTGSSSATYPAGGSAEIKTTAICFSGRRVGHEVPVLL